MRALEQFLFISAFQKAAGSDMSPTLSGAKKTIDDIYKNQHKQHQKTTDALRKENMKLKTDLGKVQYDTQKVQLEAQQAQQQAQVDSQKMQMDLQKKELAMQAKAMTNAQGAPMGPTPPPAQTPYPGMPGSATDPNAQEGGQAAGGNSPQTVPGM